MKSEIRRELRILKKMQAKVSRDRSNARQSLINLEAAALKICKQTRAQIAREIGSVNRRAGRELTKIDRRVAILNGRLS